MIPSHRLLLADNNTLKVRCDVIVPDRLEGAPILNI